MLVAMKELLVRASKENYGVAAPNVSHELDARAVIEAAESLRAPLILDVAYGHSADIVFFGGYLTKLAEMSNVPIAINLDHGATFEQAIWGIRSGFTSIMVDRSSLPYEENIKEVAEICRIAHAVGVSVEAELGHVGSGANYAVDGNSALTDPKQVCDYIARTGIDCLAVAIGTAHGTYSGIPHIDFDRLKEIKSKVGQEFPLVLHGGSGSGDDNLAKVCKLGINKVNIATDLMKASGEDLVKLNIMENNGFYKIWSTAKEGTKRRMAELIEIFGGKDKAWIPVKQGITPNYMDGSAV
jgi:fructose-bisphosphate aldolase class II